MLHVVLCVLHVHVYIYMQYMYVQWSEVTCMSFEDTVKVKNICHIDGTGYTIRYYKHSYTSIETGLHPSPNIVAGGVAMLDLAM